MERQRYNPHDVVPETRIAHWQERERAFQAVLARRGLPYTPVAYHVGMTRQELWRAHRVAVRHRHFVRYGLNPDGTRRDSPDCQAAGRPAGDRARWVEIPIQVGWRGDQRQPGERVADYIPSQPLVGDRHDTARPTPRCWRERRSRRGR